MNRRLHLPTVDPAATTPASVDPASLRRALGGRLTGPSDPAVGQCATLAGRPEQPVVVLHADETDVHVWVGTGLVRRAPRSSLVAFAGEVPADLAAVARDASTFATLVEGQPVRFLRREPAGALDHGLLVEKCRFGALVERPDGSLVGVGFRRVWAGTDAVN